MNTGSNEACDYITTGQCEATTSATKIVTFWGLLIAVIIVACIVEIGALYWYLLLWPICLCILPLIFSQSIKRLIHRSRYSIKNSVLVADALDMHLVCLRLCVSVFPRL